MELLQRAKSSELHVHIGGCLTAEDLLELGRKDYKKVDWTLFVEGYERVFGLPVDPIALYREALKSGGADVLRPYCVYNAADGGDFARFQAKFNFSICLFRHWWHVLAREEEVLARILARHKSEKLRYVEYRAMAPFGPENPEAFIQFHATMARAIQAACGQGFQARYLVSLPRWAPLESYRVTRQLLGQHPDLLPTIVGLDFCHFEEDYPPESTRAFFRQLHQDNDAHPAHYLDVAYHVGEVYFDKSLESAVRWCHEAAELGAARLGHCTALGLDPAVAVGRQHNAHIFEPTCERMAQIRYDLRHQDALRRYEVAVDTDALQAELALLGARPHDEPVQRTYDETRLHEARQRQCLVLDRLAELGVVIETCPTSNLRIGAVPNAKDHPIHRFLQSDVALAISADDPGVFDCTLADEVDWVAQHAGLASEALQERLGDPRHYRFGLRRPFRARQQTGPIHL